VLGSDSLAAQEGQREVEPFDFAAPAFFVFQVTRDRDSGEYSCFFYGPDREELPRLLSDAGQALDGRAGFGEDDGA
jgi:hypothetical protein